MQPSFGVESVNIDSCCLFYKPAFFLKALSVCLQRLENHDLKGGCFSINVYNCFSTARYFWVEGDDVRFDVFPECSLRIHLYFCSPCWLYIEFRDYGQLC